MKVMLKSTTQKTQEKGGNNAKNSQIQFTNKLQLHVDKTSKGQVLDYHSEVRTYLVILTILFINCRVHVHGINIKEGRCGTTLLLHPFIGESTISLASITVRKPNIHIFDRQAFLYINVLTPLSLRDERSE